MHKQISLMALALPLCGGLAKGQKEQRKPPDEQQGFEGSTSFW